MGAARQDGTHTRLVIITHNQPGVLGEITSMLGKKKVNIAQQLNVSREDVAYNVIDLSNYPDSAEADELQKALMAVEGVLSTRLIWWGTAEEGPSSFFTQSGGARPWRPKDGSSMSTP